MIAYSLMHFSDSKLILFNTSNSIKTIIMNKIGWIFILFFAFQIQAKETTNSYNKSLLPTPPPDVANDTLFIDLQNAVYSFTNTGNFLDIPIFVKSKGPVSSFDFRLKFNQTKLTYISTTNIEKQLQPFTSLNPNDNFLRNNTAGPSVSYVIPNNTTLVNIRFQINVPCTSITENDFFSITTLLVGYPCKNQVTPVTPITSNTLLTTSLLSIGKTIEFKGPSKSSGIPITSYIWDLGNGQTSNEQNVNSAYLEPGNYLVKLEITTMEGCKDTLSQLLQFKAASIDIKDPISTVKIFPNPASESLNIISGVKSKVMITDITGKKVIYMGDLQPNNQQTIHVSNFLNGIYLVKVFNETFHKVEKIEINN
jgi:PKD repeat protein